MSDRKSYSEVEAELSKNPLGKPASYQGGHNNYLDPGYIPRDPKGIPAVVKNASLLRDRALLSAIALVTTFALLAPTDILDRLPALAVLGNFFAAVLPSMDGFTSVAVWPQVMRATLTLAAITVLVAWPFVLWSQWQIQDVRKIRDHPHLRRWGWVYSAFAIFPFILVGPNVAELHLTKITTLLICQSRFALALFVSSMVGLEVILLAWPFVWAKSVFAK